MSYAHIYARKDGRYTARLNGEVAGEGTTGTVTYTSHPAAFPNEESAAHWIRLAVSSGRVKALPEPKVISRG